MAARRPRPRPAPVDPPLVTLQQHLAAIGHAPAIGVTAYRPKDPEESLFTFRATNWDDLPKRQVGNHHDISIAYMNAALASDVLQQMTTRAVQGGAKVAGRTLASYTAAVGAAQTVNSALLMHLRTNVWYELATLTLLRTAIDLAGRGAHTALGAGDASSRWYRRQRLHARDYWADADPLAARHHAGADRPSRVYEWLCGFTHIERSVSDHNPTHEDAYAALTYVAWFTATVAEVVSGLDGNATWPTAWPATLPWNRPPQP